MKTYSQDIDRSFLLAVLFLLGLGLVQVYSSSFIFAIESFNDGLHFVKKQSLFVVLGLIILLATAYSPWQWIKKISLTLWVLSFLGVALTMIPGLGVKVGGATRWLNLSGGLRFEPSEILKYTYPLALSYFLVKLNFNKNHTGSYMDNYTGNRKTSESNGWFKFDNLCYGLLLLAPLLILLRQPDFGSVVILLVVGFAVLFSRGLKWRYVFSTAAMLCATFYFLVMREEYRRARVTAFLDPWSDPAQKGFQIIQSMLGFYSGGVTGVGMGQGQGKLFFLPEAHTDFTLSVLGEELGFIGIILTMSCFGFVILRGFQISARAKGQFEQTASLGVVLIFGVTAFVNAGVALGLLPTKGLGMPFLSYGGSALVATCFGLGLLLNIDRQANIDRQVNINRQSGRAGPLQ